MLCRKDEFVKVAHPSPLPPREGELYSAAEVIQRTEFARGALNNSKTSSAVPSPGEDQNKLFDDRLRGAEGQGEGELFKQPLCRLFYRATSNAEL